MRITKATERLLACAVDIEQRSVQDRKELGFTARSLVLCTIPHSEPVSNEFTRKNGDYTLSMWSPNGLPYGSIPRMLLAWITTEAVRTKKTTLVLGQSLSEFMRKIDMPINGGAKGGITRLRDQMRRLFATTVVCTYTNALHDKGRRFDIADAYNLWWHPQQADQAGLWESTLTLSQKFYAEVVASPIPIDLQALKALKRSPMALDIYLWLTFRNSYLKTSTVITWDQLQMQFGAEYGRSRDFKGAFSDALRKVLIVYPAAKIVTNSRGIVVSPSPTHVSKQQGKKLSRK